MVPRDTTSNAELSLHIAQVRSLTGQIEFAISSIEHNDLQELENCMAVQEALCRELAATKSILAPASTESKSAGGKRKLELREEIHQAYSALAQANRVYAAVLRRAQRSSQILVAIYAGFGQGFAKNTPNANQSHTLSCEV